MREPQPRDIAGHTCVVLDADGPPIGDADSARDLIEAAMTHQASVVAVPVSRLDDAFFRLRTGLAGEVLQKMVNYRLRLAVIGDISEHVNASDAFRDLVREAEHGDSIFFVQDIDALTARLAKVAVRSHE